MRADHRRLPFTIGTDKHASYPEAFTTSVKEKIQKWIRLKVRSGAYP